LEPDRKLQAVHNPFSAPDPIDAKEGGEKKQMNEYLSIYTAGNHLPLRLARCIG
jgi:hypothetical protein